MKAIFVLSINSYRLQKILNKNKGYEVRKSVPSIVGYFNGKIIGKFILKKIETIKYVGSERHATDNLGDASLRYKTCLSIEKMHSFLKESVGYAWHIDELEVFDEPKLLIDYNITRAPQSYCYATI